MTTFSITLKGDALLTPKTVMVEADTALAAQIKAKADNPAYTEVLACTIVRANY